MDNYNTPFYHMNNSNNQNDQNGGYNIPVEHINTDNLKKTYKIAALGILMLYAAIFVSQTIMVVVTVFVNPFVINEGWYNLFLTDVPIYFIAIWIFLFFMLKLTPVKPQKRKFGIGNSFAIFPVACFIMLAGSIIGNMTDGFLQNFFNVELDDALSQTAETMSLPVQILFFVIIAPIGEELFFRKLLMDRTVRFGEGAAIMFSGVTFAIFHGNFNQLFYAFGVGLLLAYLYAKTGSYIRCVLLHAGANAFFGVLYPWLFDASQGGNSTMKALFSFATLLQWGLFIAGLVLFVVYLACKKITIEKSEYKTLEPVSKLAFVNAPFIVYSSVILVFALSKYMPQ